MFVCVQLFSEMLMEDRSRQDLGEIRDLAKRLAMSFGIDLHRVRKPMVALHMQVTHASLTNTYTPAPSGYHSVYLILIVLSYSCEYSFSAFRGNHSSVNVKETNT